MVVSVKSNGTIYLRMYVYICIITSDKKMGLPRLNKSVHTHACTYVSFTTLRFLNSARDIHNGSNDYVKT